MPESRTDAAWAVGVVTVAWRARATRTQIAKTTSRIDTITPITPIVVLEDSVWPMAEVVVRKLLRAARDFVPGFDVAGPEFSGSEAVLETSVGIVCPT